MTWQFLAAGSLIPAGVMLTWLIQSTVLLAAGLLAGHLLRKRGPAVQSALYRTTLGAVILCPVASASMAAMGFSGLLIRLPAPSQNDRNAFANEPFGREIDRSIDGNEARFQRDDALAAQASQTRVSQTLPGISPHPTSEAGVAPLLVASVPLAVQSDALRQWADWIAWASALFVMAWLLGAAALGVRLLVGHHRMARLRSTAIDAEPDVVVLCRDLARRMRLDPPSVLRSPFLCSPCLDGLRRPAILLPEDAEENLRETFTHELAHLQRRDGLWNILRHSGTAVFWVQPLLWILSKRLEATAEEVCDDYVVAFGADRCRYAGHLLELAERRLPPLAPSGVGMISLRSLLARRITRILDSTRTLSTQAGGREIAATLLAGVAGTLFVGLLGVGGGNRTVIAAELKVEKASREKPTSKKVTPAMNPASTMPITGRIVDLEGRPVAGATVQVTQITKPKGDDLDPWIEAVKRGEPPWIAYQHLIYEPPIAPEEKRPSATTDTQGRFGFNGLAAESLVELAIGGPTIAYTPLKVVTRRIEPIPARGFPSQHGPGSQTVYGTDFTFTAAPGRPVEGVIRDAKTKQPMMNVGIWSNSFAGSDFIGTKVLKTTTDDQGRFRLVGLPKGRGNAIIAVPNDDQPYFMQSVAVPDPPGIAPVSIEINLHKGIWIEGKVTEKGTGLPVPKAWLEYFPFLENTFAQATPGFEKDGNVPAASSVQDRYQTKSDGTYRMVGLPGRAIVGVVVYSERRYLQGAGSESINGMDKHGNFPTYRNPVVPSRLFPASMKEINPPDATKPVHLDLELFAGAKVRLRVVDPQGRPVSGVRAAGRSGRDGHDREPQKEADFDVVTLADGEDRMVLIRHEERKLGKVIHVREGDDKNGPAVMTLVPLATITGRVLNADGNPVSGATIRTDPLPGGDFSLSLSQVASDKAGQFVVPNVPQGCKYSLVVESGIEPKTRRVAFFNNAAVRAGESTDVGDIRFKND